MYPAEAVGGRLSPGRLVMVQFSECKATLKGIIRIVQDNIRRDDPMVLNDVQGNAKLEFERKIGGLHESYFTFSLYFE